MMGRSVDADSGRVHFRRGDGVEFPGRRFERRNGSENFELGSVAEMFLISMPSRMIIPNQERHEEHEE